MLCSHFLYYLKGDPPVPHVSVQTTQSHLPEVWIECLHASRSADVNLPPSNQTAVCMWATNYTAVLGYCVHFMSLTLHFYLVHQTCAICILLFVFEIWHPRGSNECGVFHSDEYESHWERLCALLCFLTGRRFHFEEQIYSVRRHWSWNHITHKVIPQKSSHKVILWERVIESRCGLHTYCLPEFFLTNLDSSLSNPAINVLYT